MKRHGSLLALAASLLFSLLGILLAYLSHARALLPYNEQGIYFDGASAFKEQAVEVYALLAVLAFALAALCLALYRRFR